MHLKAYKKNYMYFCELKDYLRLGKSKFSSEMIPPNFKTSVPLSETDKKFYTIVAKITCTAVNKM